jgi:uncharacterized membrane protein YbaN (DUF454 family)
MKRLLYLIIGCICLGLGAVGAFLPLLPTVPFLLAAAFCFTRSSQRLHAWFINTKLYQNNLADYAAGRGMRRDAKRRIILSVSLVMGIGFGIMFYKAIYLPCAILSAVWCAHLVYFLWGVKTLEPEEE